MEIGIEIYFTLGLLCAYEKPRYFQSEHFHFFLQFKGIVFYGRETTLFKKSFIWVSAIYICQAELTQELIP